MEKRKPISRSDLPTGYFRLIEDPDETVARWKKRCELRAEYAALQKEEAATKKMPASNSDLKKNIQTAYQNYQNQLIQNARKYLEKTKGQADGLQNLYKYAHLYKLDSYIPLEILLAAADLIADTNTENSISDAARKSALAKIETEKIRVKTELAKVSPAEDFGFDNGQAHSDLIDDFVSHWRKIQGSTHGECDARGIDLKYSAEIDQQLFYRLGLDKIKPYSSAKWLPYSPE